MRLSDVRPQTFPRCTCALTFTVQIGQPGEYRRCKTLLNDARHPTFVGRQLVERHAVNGGLLFFRYDGSDVGVTVINVRKNVLLVLAVDPRHRGHGLASAMVRFIQANWVRSTETTAGFFERLGYVRIGRLKRGRTLNTQMLVRGNLIGLAGRVQRALQARMLP